MDIIDVAGKTEMELALIVSRFIEPTSDHGVFLTQYSEFTAMVRERIDGTSSLDLFLEEYGKTGFVQEQSVEMEIWHSDVVRVFEDKKGIPISLGVLLIETANRCGFTAKGVNYPGHYLVHINEQLVDPVSLRKLDPGQIDEKSQDQTGLLAPVAPVVTFLRMLNNLKALQSRDQNWAECIELVDMQLSVSQGNDRLKASLMFEKGEFWTKMEVYLMARENFLEAARLSGDKEFIEQCEARVISVSNFEQVVH